MVYNLIFNRTMVSTRWSFYFNCSNNWTTISTSCFYWIYQL